MITFVSNTQNPALVAAMEKAEELLQPESSFLREVAKIDRFAMANIAGPDLVKLFQQDLTVSIQTYRPIQIFSRALGYSVDGEDTVYINAFKLRRSQASIVATIIHELVHILDHHDKIHRFGHGDNFAQGKEETAPYKLDEIAEDLVGLEGEPVAIEKKGDKHGSFVFRNGVGYEIPRSELYHLAKESVNHRSCPIL